MTGIQLQNEEAMLDHIVKYMTDDERDELNIALCEYGTGVDAVNRVLAGLNEKYRVSLCADALLRLRSGEGLYIPQI